ncbi:unnamed protein product [Dibothriocephalus latus]|uniref:E3 ubiquitin-protein ligase UBR-like C-terminal domain-containing protein n=1 Tax=Dibothriocephalus latus TaxID=60516 RepID=A0A3P7L0N9_DIBLA|nr:unnamed protein product [Dibothriocephalus latus]
MRLLCGLPKCEENPSAAAAIVTTLRSLFAHLRTTCLPFLRIAAFIMQEITAIDVPAATLRQPSAGKSIDEFTLLLAYLGLPLGPEDLLTVLSVECGQPDDKEKLFSMKCQSGDSSSALCLARLIIAWCHAGRSSASRDLYAKLCQHSLPQLTNHPVLLPQPQIRVPHLIHLPREYVRLSALATEWQYVPSIFPYL